MKREELQQILLTMLENVDKVLVEEDIPYSLCAGSMLGAVRHQGFIPWDDDMDIWIWKKDRDRLCKVLREKLPSQYDIVEPGDLLPNFYDFVFRIIDKRYQWHIATPEDEFYDNKQNHVCIDIFCFIHCPSFFLSRNWLFLKQKIIYGLALGHRYQLKNEKYSFLQKILTGVLSRAGKNVKMDKILTWQENLGNAEDKNINHKYCVTINGIPSCMGQYHLAKDCTKTKRMKFEHTEFPVYSGYDHILSRQYGDYMTPVHDSDEYVTHMNFDD